MGSEMCIRDRGLSQGVDFEGGRTYVVRFDGPVSTNELRSVLGDSFVDDNGIKMYPEVKTFGNTNQVKITTNYMINDLEADVQVEGKVNSGISSFSDGSYEIMSSQLVGPTIADDIKSSAVWSILFSLVLIFLYILFRFKKWQYSLGAVIAVFHDVLILSLIHI